MSKSMSKKPKLYSYENRRIIQFTNGKRASYSKKLYEGSLLDKATDLSLSKNEKIQNFYLLDAEEGIVKIFLKEDCYTIVDLTDFDLIKNIHWSLNHNGYAHSRQGGKTRYLHREILASHTKYKTKSERTLVVDHINNIRLDNRLSNLRYVTLRGNTTNKIDQENMGVNKHSHGGYRARWSVQGKDFSKYFSGEDAEKRAKEYRLQKMKETGYLRTFNDYPEEE